MASEEHQILVNKLALALERRGNITIQAIDLDGAPQHFDPKYRGLPLPSTREGSIPDLEGMDANGVAHLGEAETDMNADNLDDQLKNFSNWAMTNTDPPHPNSAAHNRAKAHMVGNEVPDTRHGTGRQAGQAEI